MHSDVRVWRVNGSFWWRRGGRGQVGSEIVVFFLLWESLFLFTGPRPLDLGLKAFPYRLLMGVVIMMCVWWANVVRGPGEEFFPLYFYLTILLVYAIHQVLFITVCFHEFSWIVSRNLWSFMMHSKEKGAVYTGVCCLSCLFDSKHANYLGMSSWFRFINWITCSHCKYFIKLTFRALMSTFVSPFALAKG